MIKWNRILRWIKRLLFALIVHTMITGIILAFMMGLWFLSNASYESKGTQLGVLTILVLPFILDIPAIITLLEIKKLRKFLS